MKLSTIRLLVLKIRISVHPNQKQGKAVNRKNSLET